MNITDAIAMVLLAYRNTNEGSRVPVIQGREFGYVELSVTPLGFQITYKREAYVTPKEKTRRLG